MHGTDVVQDDQIWIEADILVADHPNVSTNDVISVTFAIKVSWAKGVFRMSNSLSHFRRSERENINSGMVEEEK